MSLDDLKHWLANFHHKDSDDLPQLRKPFSNIDNISHNRPVSGELTKPLAEITNKNIPSNREEIYSMNYKTR